jgi:RNase H-fold protein (predicted Holliday junction resolvase)
MPYDLYGIDHKQLNKTKSFIVKLKDLFPHIEIIEMDERFTTFESIQLLQEIGHKKMLFEKKDSFSAACILERYLGI